MKFYRADLHIHSVLSPCAGLEMSPLNIINTAKANELSIIGITDHNSTRQGEIIKKLGDMAGIEVMTGAEVTTREEVHCLVFADGQQNLRLLQSFLDDHLPSIPNDPNRFGFQVVVDANDKILYNEEKLLISALDIGINQLITFMQSIGGIIIPAHIDRLRYGLTGQLGFIPSGLQVNALELSSNCDIPAFLLRHPEALEYTLVRGSDAHTLAAIGSGVMHIRMSHPAFAELRMALTFQNHQNFLTIH